MFKTRLISGIVLILVALGAMYCGGYVLFALIALLSLIGEFELYRVFKIHDKLPGIVGYAMTVFYYALIMFDNPAHFEMGIIVFMILLLAVYVFSFPKYTSKEITAAFFGFFYVALMLSFIYLTRELPDGVYLVWLVFIASWGCDTCAYCVGMLFGKHKMSPKLSPKKSVEGAFGGVIGAALLGVLYSVILAQFDDISSNVTWVWALIGGVGGLVSMVGDLAASAIKRNNDIKDYGKLIPGHGGVLDRFDSVIITAPIIYFLSIYVL